MPITSKTATCFIIVSNKFQIRTWQAGPNHRISTYCDRYRTSQGMQNSFQSTIHSSATSHMHEKHVHVWAEPAVRGSCLYCSTQQRARKDCTPGLPGCKFFCCLHGWILTIQYWINCSPIVYTQKGGKYEGFLPVGNLGKSLIIFSCPKISYFDNSV